MGRENPNQNILLYKKTLSLSSSSFNCCVLRDPMSPKPLKPNQMVHYEWFANWVSLCGLLCQVLHDKTRGSDFSHFSVENGKKGGKLLGTPGVH
jgi:hypothetical protein